MDLKSDDIFNVDIDPTLLLSYELDKLNLENIPNDIFELPEEIQKSENHLDVERSLLPVEANKSTEISIPSKDHENEDLKTLITSDKSCAGKLKLDTQLKRKKDINGNVEASSDDNLNHLLSNLELSDSDNEEKDGESCSKLRERAPVRSQKQKHALRNQSLTNYLGRKENYDKTQFDSQKLKFWCGSNNVQSNETSIVTNQFTFHNSVLSNLSGGETVFSLSNRDSFYEDIRANSVGSPESGYESSITGSPPQVSLSASVTPFLDLIPETVDEQNVLDFLVESTTECALTDHNVSRDDTDDKDPKGKITEILNFLKDTPADLNESFNAVSTSDNSSDYVPSVKDSQSEQDSVVSQLSKNVETPKKLVYKLEDKAKSTLRKFLAYDAFYATKARIYRKVNEDKEKKVIYVEDEMERASENRTNLHHAVLKSNIEEIYCLIEIHKQYNKPFTDINIRDKYGKTALDYAIQNDMTLVVNYLKENTACQSVNI